MSENISAHYSNAINAFLSNIAAQNCYLKRSSAANICRW